MRKRQRGEITTEHILQKENPEQKKRRMRKDILKIEFRKVGERTAIKFFGETDPKGKTTSHLDIIREETNCSEEIIKGMMRLSPDKFDDMFAYFLSEIELESGKLRYSGKIANGIIGLQDEVFKEKLARVSVELLMATESEQLPAYFVSYAGHEEDREVCVKMIDGLLKFAKIDYIHSVRTFAMTFATNPISAADMIEKMANRIDIRASDFGRTSVDTLPSDVIISEDIVKPHFGWRS